MGFSNRYDHDSAAGLAYRMAGMHSDPDFIFRWVEQEWGKGKAPSIKRIVEFQKMHANKAAYGTHSAINRSYNEANDPGEPYRVPGLKARSA